MEYVGIQTQQRRNNMRSLTLLVLFPLLILALVWLFLYLLCVFSYSGTAEAPYIGRMTLYLFGEAAPWVVAFIAVWFGIAYFTNTSIINKATHARPLDRKENKRVYNLVENLCMAQGMPMPKVNVIDDSSLNAFASGINKKTYAVTLTSGIIEKLDDQELEGVIAHELSHIRNNDVRLLIISIVFVGIFTMIGQIALRMVLYAPRSRGNKKGGGGIIVMALLAAVLAFIGFLCSRMMKFAISRKREYLADAGAAEMTKNPMALANALRKISDSPSVESVTREDVAQLFIEHPLNKKKGKGWFRSLFATHPPIEKRIEVLEQF